MGSKNNACEACAQACFDAKQKVPQLEKRLYALTIVMTVALTLVGRELIKEVADYLSSINNVVEQSNQLQNTINSDSTGTTSVEKVEQAPVSVGVNTPPSVIKEFPSTAVKQDVKIKSPIGIASIDVPSSSSSSTSYINQSTTLTKLISSNAVDVAQSSFLATTPQFADNHSVLLTPSLLPFDVYSTTLGLGINYGFGGYYGIDTGWSYIPPSIPEPATMTLFGLYPVFSSRRK